MFSSAVEDYTKAIKFDPKNASAFHGYHFRLLTAQGKDAPGGARSYLVKGRLLGGFGVVAYPAQYGNSGIMTFIVNQDGVVREKDPRVGYTTVYRTMKLLADCGLAREIDLADGITRYEHLYNHQHHDHMICMECGNSIEFYDPDLEALQDEASEHLGFKVLDHKLQIYGVCRDCRKMGS